MANVELEAGGPARPGWLSLDFSFVLSGIWPLLLAGLVVRLIFATATGFGVDIGTFRFWGEQLAANGTADFYDKDFFTDYAPGYMYVLLLIGELHEIFGFSSDQWEYILKVPSIIADLASAYVLWRFLEDQRPEVRLGAAALYLAFPPALLIGPVWGQVDSILAFFLLLSVYYISKDRPVAGAVAFTLGFLTKPQAIAALPFLAFWIMRRYPPALWYRPALAGLGLTLIVITPFFTYRPWELIDQLASATDIENYRVNSFWAYNFWNMFGLFDSGFQPDVDGIKAGEGLTWGIENRWWGVAMFGAAIALILFSLRKAEGKGWLALGTALSVLAFYLFLTRMHERYLFPAFLPMLAAAAVIHSRWLWAGFISLSVVHFLNLYHVYIYYNHTVEHPNSLRVGWLYDDVLARTDFLWTGLETVQVLSIILVAGFVALIACAFLRWQRPRTAPA